MQKDFWKPISAVHNYWKIALLHANTLSLEVTCAAVKNHHTLSLGPPQMAKNHHRLPHVLRSSIDMVRMCQNMPVITKSRLFVANLPLLRLCIASLRIMASCSCQSYSSEMTRGHWSIPLFCSITMGHIVHAMIFSSHIKKFNFCREKRKESYTSLLSRRAGPFFLFIDWEKRRTCLFSFLDRRCIGLWSFL